MLVSVTFLSNLKQTILLSQVKIKVDKSCSQNLIWFIEGKEMGCFGNQKLNSENLAFMSLLKIYTSCEVMTGELGKFRKW